MQLKDNKELIFLGIVGSHAYGLNTEESDKDYKGICFGSRSDYLGITQFEQLEGGVHLSDCGFGVNKDDDVAVFDFVKYVRLLKDNNPNIIELLNLPDFCNLYETPVYKLLVENQALFICSNVRFRYSGYAHSQAKRIETHRKWLLNPPKSKPERSDFKLKDETKQNYLVLRAECLKILQEASLDDLDIPKETIAEIQFRLEDRVNWDIFSRKLEEDRLSDGILLSSGIPEGVVEYFKRERQYHSALNHFNSYEKWKKNRNPKRALLEEKCGYDSKHATHLIRLMRTGIEILEGKGVIVYRREDREELLDIRQGNWSYERVMGLFTKLNEQAEIAYINTWLQKIPQHNKIDDLTVSILEKHLKMGAS